MVSLHIYMGQPLTIKKDSVGSKTSKGHFHMTLTESAGGTTNQLLSATRQLTLGAKHTSWIIVEGQNRYAVVHC